MPISDVNSRRTREEHSRDSRKGGINSGVARRRKRNLKDAVDLLFSLPVADREQWNQISALGVAPGDIDNQMAVLVGLTLSASAGDPKAAKLLFDILDDGKEQPTIADDGLLAALADNAADIGPDDGDMLPEEDEAP